jgi:hypothetical protein
MKRLLSGGLLALGLALTATPAQAGCTFDYSVCRHISLVFTGRTRCLSYTSCSNPVPCPSGCSNIGYGCGSGPALWDGLAAYGAYPAPVVAAPTAPANTAPSFKAPQPTPATKSTTGLQQAAYYYYAQASQAGYSYNAGYNYGAGYVYYGSAAQVPDYWY